MPKPLSPDTRAAIISDIRAAKHTGIASARSVARKHGVAPSTITRLAAEAGIPDAFERSQTVKATHAQQADNAAKRARLITKFYATAEELLDRVSQPHTVAMAGPEGIEFVTTKLPTLRDAQAGMAASAIGIDKALRLEDKQGDGRVDAAKSLLGNLFEHLQRAHGDAPDGSG